MKCLHVYLIQPCLLCRGRVSVQQFRDGVVLRLCCGLTLPCLLGFSTDSYYVATIPKSRFEFLDSFLIFLFVEFLEGIPCIVNLHSLHTTL